MQPGRKQYLLAAVVMQVAVTQLQWVNGQMLRRASLLQWDIMQRQQLMAQLQWDTRYPHPKISPWQLVLELRHQVMVPHQSVFQIQHQDEDRWLLEFQQLLQDHIRLPWVTIQLLSAMHPWCWEDIIPLSDYQMSGICGTRFLL